MRDRSRPLVTLLAALLLAGTACDLRGAGAWLAPPERTEAAAGSERGTVVLVYEATKSCGHGPSDYEADRVRVRTPRVLTAALRLLMQRLREPGDPRAAELLRGVSVEDGLATVDFRTFGDTSLGWAGTSCGGTAFWGMLNRTVFQFPSVRAVRYEMDGSCATFQELVQSACVEGRGILTRAEWER